MAEFSLIQLASDANLIAYYKLENVNDSKGTKHLTNTGTCTFASAVYNNGVDCGSSNSTKYLTISDRLSINGGAVTIAGWFKLYSTTGTHTLVSLGSGTTSYVNYVLYWDGANTFGGGANTVVANRQKQLVANNVVTSAKSPGTSSFHHYALTYNGTTLTLYYDGQSIGTPLNCSGNGSGTANDKFQIGFNNGQSGSIYGSIIADDVVVFNRALSGTEISDIYVGTPAVIPTTNYLKPRRSRLDTIGVSL